MYPVTNQDNAHDAPLLDKNYTKKDDSCPCCIIL